METDILSSLEKARQFLRPGNQAKFDAFEKRVKEALVMVRLKHTDAIQMLINHYEEEIENINKKLLDESAYGMSDEAKKILFLRRFFCEDFLKFFEKRDTKLETHRKAIEARRII